MSEWKLKASDLPPGPYNVQVNTSGFAYVVDANGKKIASLLGSNKVKGAIGALLIKARAAVRVSQDINQKETP